MKFIVAILLAVLAIGTMPTHVNASAPTPRAASLPEDPGIH